MTGLPRLQRDESCPPAPIRILHLGLGNFFRAHQAWYTANAPDSGEWGIAAFTGRRPDMARELAPQDGLYTLVTRAPSEDELQLITSVSAVHTASDQASWLEYFLSPDVAIVTITVTEAGYFFDGEGLAADPAVESDIEALGNDPVARLEEHTSELQSRGHLVCRLLLDKNTCP